MNAKVPAWLLALLAAVLILRPPQEKTVYVIVQTAESGEIRYTEAEEVPTENGDRSEDESDIAIVIIVIIILVWLLGCSETEMS